MKNENKSKKEEGLPEISQESSKKQPIVVVLISIVVAVFFSMYFHTKTNKKGVQPIEDTYVIQNDSTENKKLPPVVEQGIPAAPPSTKLSQEIIQQQIMLLQEKQKELQQRLTAPLMLVNGSQSKTTPATVQQAQAVSKDGNTQFMNQVSVQNTETVTATTIGPLNYVIAEGNYIHATLEPASNSDLPGDVRAIVSEPVYSQDGTKILIPPGSPLIGQYKSGMLQGQSRIFVVWKRLITPSGISVNLGSAGVDSLGVAGMGADEINRHFWERFGTASLLSLIGAGAANVGVKSNMQDNSASSYRSAVANSFAQSADQSLQQESMIASTLKTHQGKPIMVFVARDLNFQSAMKQIKPNINVF
jgi:type IV secretion system protein VirB10